MGQSACKNRRILVVDDEPDLLETVAAALKRDGFTRIDTAACLQEARRRCRQAPPDLAVLDIMLPDGSGYGFCAELRAQGDIPVIFLTARGETEDRLRGLGMGADDYIVKPFSPQELALRLAAVLRRCYKEESLEDAPVRLDAGRLELSRALFVREDGRETALTAKECALLRVLCRNAGRIVTLDALCAAVWGENYYGYESSLPVHIRRIREKIEREPSRPAALLTVRGLGYKLLRKTEADDGAV